MYACTKNNEMIRSRNEETGYNSVLTTKVRYQMWQKHLLYLTEYSPTYLVPQKKQVPKTLTNMVIYKKHFTQNSLICVSNFHIVYLSLITCVIVQSNPRRLLPIWREKLRGYYHVTMTSDNDFCVWRWHYRERHSRVSVVAQSRAMHPVFAQWSSRLD